MRGPVRLNLGGGALRRPRNVAVQKSAPTQTQDENIPFQRSRKVAAQQQQQKQACETAPLELSGSALEQELQDIATQLRNVRSVEWDQRVRAMVSVQRLCVGEETRAVLGRSLGTSGIRTGLVAQLGDLRSQIVKVAVETVSKLANCTDLGPHLGALVPALAHLLPSSKAIMSIAGQKGLLTLVGHTSSACMMPHLLPLLEDKHDATRSHGAQLVATLLKKEPCADPTSLSPILRRLVSDRNGEVRKAARECVIAFRDSCPSAGHLLVASLEPGVRKRLPKGTAAPIAATAAVVAKPLHQKKKKKKKKQAAKLLKGPLRVATAVTAAPSNSVPTPAAALVHASTTVLVTKPRTEQEVLQDCDSHEWHVRQVAFRDLAQLAAEGRASFPLVASMEAVRTHLSDSRATVVAAVVSALNAMCKSYARDMSPYADALVPKMFAIEADATPLMNCLSAEHVQGCLLKALDHSATSVLVGALKVLHSQCATVPAQVVAKAMRVRKRKGTELDAYVMPLLLTMRALQPSVFLDACRALPEAEQRDLKALLKPVVPELGLELRAGVSGLDDLLPAVLHQMEVSEGSDALELLLSVLDLVEGEPVEGALWQPVCVTRALECLRHDEQEVRLTALDLLKVAAQSPISDAWSGLVGAVLIVEDKELAMDAFVLGVQCVGPAECARRLLRVEEESTQLRQLQLLAKCVEYMSQEDAAAIVDDGFGACVVALHSAHLKQAAFDLAALLTIKAGEEASSPARRAFPERELLDMFIECLLRPR